MITLLKIKSFVLKHWKAFVTGFTLTVGMIIGFLLSSDNVFKSDVDAKDKAGKDTQKGTDRAIDDYQKSKEEISTEKSENEISADKKEEESKKDLLKDPSKLDTILERKYGLKGD